MHNARPQDAINTGEVFTMVKKGIDQCAGRISISRMNDHTWRLVNYNERWVLIKNGKRKGLCLEGKRFGLRKNP
jgi:3-methyladenine DNA glycosylase Mpg